MPTLNMPTRDYGLMRRMKTLTALNDDIGLEFPSFENILTAARGMVREAAFDICEMPITTYLCAKGYGKRMTAIPVFLTRNFHHGAIFHDAGSGVAEPRDLEGKTVGVVRGYTVTTGVWARYVLAAEYGVDLEKIRWAATDDEHVAEFVPPANADYDYQGRDMAGLFESGDIVAAIGAIPSPPAGVRPLIADAVEAGFASYRKTGIFPINHTIVVRDDLLETWPNLAADLFAALKASKDAYLSSLDRNAGDLSAEDKLTVQLERGVDGDPFPYGVESNRKALEALARTAFEQHITPKVFSMEELFAGGTLELDG